MNQPSIPPTVNYESFLLRLRRTNDPRASACRIHLREIGDGRERYFNSLCELVAYLRVRDDAGDTHESIVLINSEDGR